jgi:MSHA biogenesis protein MshI
MPRLNEVLNVSRKGFARMGFFSRSKEIDGWHAVSFQGGDALAVHVRRPSSGKPVVSMIASEPMDGAPPTEVLGRLAKSWQGQKHACTTVVNSDSYEFLPVDAPHVPPAELKSAIAWTVTSLIDFSNEEATIDVLSVPHDQANAHRPRAMYAVVTRAKLSNDIQRCFQDAKLSLKVIDIPEMAQRNVAGLLETEGRALALLSFDAGGGLLTFTSGGELYLARRIPITPQQLLDSAPESRERYQEDVALEIQRSIDHFGREFSWVGLDCLLVAPIGDDHGGLVDYLSANISTPVAALNLESIFDMSRVPELKSLRAQEKYFMTLGLALRHEEKVL